MSLQLQPPAKYTKIWQEMRYTRLFTNELTNRYPIFSIWTHRAWTLVDVRMVRATKAHTLSMLQTIFSQREPPRILFRGVSEAPHRSSCHERRLFFCLSVRRRCPRHHVSARINLNRGIPTQKEKLLVEKRFPAIVYPSKNELLFTDYNFPKFLLEKEQNTPKPSSLSS